MGRFLAILVMLGGCGLYTGNGGGTEPDANAADSAIADAMIDAPPPVDAAPPDAPAEIACDQATDGMTQRADLGVCEVVIPTGGAPLDGFCTPLTGGALWTCDDVWIDPTGREGVPLMYPDGGCSIAWCTDGAHQ